ncbi:IclR family transcriptional regulator [Bryobacter aggregatus]|uniref:IclR family transcriptional regulator n=1 Tax=Bryobacter aggregatus TaxID=360054 RepID=UPI0004E2326D|nr:IclR family transcriptional regulator [Bryobacter aggregatus]
MKQAEFGTPTAGAVKRALAILECLDGSRRGLNISELSRKLKIPKSSTHVIVLTLERLGYLEREERGLHYSLGLKAHILGQGVMKTLRLADIAQPRMRQLADSLRVTAHLAVPDRDQGVFIQKVDAPGLIKFDTYVGRHMDLHCTAVGKVILAFGPAEIREHILAKSVYMRYTEHTLTTPRQLLRDLKRVQRLRYASDDEEEELEVRCVAVPVYSTAGQFLAALSVTGTIRQIAGDAVERIAALLKSAAAEIGAAASVQNHG